jgi:hypothetical protein
MNCKFCSMLLPKLPVNTALSHYLLLFAIPFPLTDLHAISSRSCIRYNPSQRMVVDSNNGVDISLWCTWVESSLGYWAFLLFFKPVDILLQNYFLLVIQDLLSSFSYVIYTAGAQSLEHINKLIPYLWLLNSSLLNV